MPTFKVTVLVDDSLSLGSILMTKHVELLHITELPQVAVNMERRNVITHDPVALLENVKKSSYQKEHFKHPSGRPIKDFVMEYLGQQPSRTGRWKEINQHITSLGFGKSSLNNSLKFLVENKVIKREKDGIYRIIEKK